MNRGQGQEQLKRSNCFYVFHTDIHYEDINCRHNLPMLIVAQGDRGNRAIYPGVKRDFIRVG